MSAAGNLSAAVVAATLLLCPARAQQPVLAWSAKLGPSMQSVTGTAVAADGSIYIVGRTLSSDVPGSDSFRNSNIFVAKLAPDGSNSPCSWVLGGSSEEYPRAMALVSDGTLLIAGSTVSPDFPRVPAGGAQPGQDPRTFLLRADPCDKKLRYSSYLPSGVQATALVAAKDGSVYLGARDDTAGDNGLLLHVDASGRSIISKTGLRGVPGALAIDSAESVYATGLLPPASQPNAAALVQQAFATELTADLQKAVYDVTFGDGPVTMGTALTLDKSGSLYVAGAAIPPGSIAYNGRSSEESALPFYDETATILARIMPDGSTAFLRYVELATKGVRAGSRRPVGIAIGPDGRLWMAIAGAAGFPQMLPDSYRVALSGVLLRSFRADGEPAGGETMIPGSLVPGPLPATAFGKDGRIVIASINRYLPVTQGSANAPAADAISAVAFDLALAEGAPSVTADREILDIDEVSLSGTPLVIREAKPIQLKTGNDASLGFLAAIIPDGQRVFPEPPIAFSTDDVAGRIPATINIKALSGTFNAAALIVLAPGAQGLITIPVRLRSRSATFLVQPIDLFELSAPSDEPVTFQLAVTADEFRGGALQLNLPFRISHETPWLKLEQAEGITPATLMAVVDPHGLGRGSYDARLAIEIGGVVQKSSLTLTVGPVLRTTPVPLLQVPFGKPFTHSFTILSSSSPIDFSLESLTPGIDVSPKAGRTPQEIVATINPVELPFGRYLNAFLLAKSGDLNQNLGFQFMVVPSGTTYVPDSIDGQAAPGSLITFRAGTSRCQPAQAEGTPWPTALGSCRLRVNGRDLPLGSITPVRYPSTVIIAPVYYLLAQLPYDLDGSTAMVEIEDENGKKNSLPVAIKPVLPLTRVIAGLTGFDEIVRRPGEEIIATLTGLGATDTPAPWGDVAATTIQPLARVEAFVGGRTAPVTSARLSRTEVGVFEVRFTVPPIASDLHLFNLRVGGVDVPLGAIVVTQ